jgi:peptidoglycan/LPS O-acetylase OafA/YrhL
VRKNCSRKADSKGVRFIVGVLRVLLALSVLSEHSGPIFGIHLIPGFIAVELFYIISGFYMGLIFAEKYIGHDKWKTFYVNRFLRIYPTYYLVLLVTTGIAIVLIFRGSPLPWFVVRYSEWYNLNLPTLIAAIVPNFSLVGLDFLHFFHLTPNGSLVPSIKPPLALFDPLAAGRQFTVIPQAWTLGLEIEFYLLVPWIARWRTRYIAVLIAICVISRMMFYAWGYKADPWNDRFFPFELALFLAGLLLYRLYRVIGSIGLPRLHRAIVTGGWVATACCVLALLAFAAFARKPEFASLGYGPLVNWTFVLAVAVLLPFIFAATRGSRIDNIIGQYSYPMYISHYIFIGFFADMLVNSSIGYGPTVAIFTVVFSALLLLITKPIEHRRRAGNLEALAATAKAA